VLVLKIIMADETAAAATVAADEEGQEEPAHFYDKI
jgi:hypothetical protein